MKTSITITKDLTDKLLVGFVDQEEPKFCLIAESFVSILDVEAMMELIQSVAIAWDDAMTKRPDYFNAAPEGAKDVEQGTGK